MSSVDVHTHCGFQTMLPEVRSAKHHHGHVNQHRTRSLFDMARSMVHTAQTSSLVAATLAAISIMTSGLMKGTTCMCCSLVQAVAIVVAPTDRRKQVMMLGGPCCQRAAAACQ